jgi:trimethylamine--corrinoid protein Co-methyltransferase
MRLPCRDRARLQRTAAGERPTLATVTNVNSPRRVDEEILDNIMVMARHGQCVVITPFTLMAMFITLAGALVQQTAEALAVVTLCQLVRPGTPCAWWLHLNVDMRTGSRLGTPDTCMRDCDRPAGPAPEAAGAPAPSTPLPVVDAQSTYETAFSLQAAILSSSH